VLLLGVTYNLSPWVDSAVRFLAILGGVAPHSYLAAARTGQPVPAKECVSMRNWQ